MTVPFVPLALAGIGVALLSARARARRGAVEGSNALFPTLDRFAFGSGVPAGEIVAEEATQPFERPAGRYLNIKRIRGAILTPRNGEHLRIPLFAPTYPVTVSIANDGDNPVTSRVALETKESKWGGGFFGDASQASTLTEPITLAPGDSRTLVIHVPLNLRGWVDNDVTARLKFANHLLAGSTFVVE